MTIAQGQGDVNTNGDKEVILKTPAGADLLGLALSAASLPVVLASDRAILNFTEFSLTNSRLFAVADFTSFISTSFASKLVIRNPSGSGVNLTVLLLQASIIPAATTSQINFISMRLRKNPTFSSVGTALTVHNLRFDDAGPTQAEVYELPTTISTGTIVDRPTGLNAPAIAMPFMIRPGEDILVQLSVNDANNDVYIRVMFVEEAE